MLVEKLVMSLRRADAAPARSHPAAQQEDFRPYRATGLPSVTAESQTPDKQKFTDAPESCVQTSVQTTSENDPAETIGMSPDLANVAGAWAALPGHIRAAIRRLGRVLIEVEAKSRQPGNSRTRVPRTIWPVPCPAATRGVTGPPRTPVVISRNTSRGRCELDTCKA